AAFRQHPCEVFWSWFHGDHRITSSTVGIEAPDRLIDVDLAPRHLLHELDARRRGDGGLLDAKLAEEPIEARSRRRVAHAEVSLEVLHVSSRGEKDAKHVAVFIGQGAELALRKGARKLGFTRRTAQPRQREHVIA